MAKKRVDLSELIYEIKEHSKHPKSKGKHIGVEIECLSKLSKDLICAGLINAGVNKYCQVKEDGSIDLEGDYEYDIEVCVIAREHVIANIIKKVCRVLKTYGCIVNTSCGLHVHLDMRSRSVKSAYKKLVKAQPKLQKKVRADRINGEYCHTNQCDDFNMVLGYNQYGDEEYYRLDGEVKAKFKTREEKISQAADDQEHEKYLAINPMAYEEHSTIECRLHEGTLDSKKINKWIKTLVTVVDGKAA